MTFSLKKWALFHSIALLLLKTKIPHFCLQKVISQRDIGEPWKDTIPWLSKMGYFSWGCQSRSIPFIVRQGAKPCPFVGQVIDFLPLDFHIPWAWFPLVRHRSQPSLFFLLSNGWWSIQSLVNRKVDTHPPCSLQTELLFFLAGKRYGNAYGCNPNSNGPRGFLLRLIHNASYLVPPINNYPFRRLYPMI